MTLRVEISKLIPVAPALAFDAWLTPAAMARFMCPSLEVEVENIRVDARVGGAFSLEMVAGETRIPVHGQYVEVDRPAKLSFTWLSAHTTNNSIVTLTFAEHPEGTSLTLRHEGFPDAAAQENHRGGWVHILARLAETVDGPRQ